MKDWPPEPPPPNGYPCRKCHRILFEQRKLSVHESECLDFKQGESFLKYERAKSYDTANKIDVSSQPVMMDFDKQPFQTGQPPLGPVNATSKNGQPVAGLIECGFCHRECKGMRGLKLHQKKCIGIKSSSEQSLQPGTDAAPVVASMTMKNNGHRSVQDDHVESVSTHSKCRILEPPPDVCLEINDAYEEIVSWRKNMFDLPKGHTGKQFVAHMNKLVVSWTNKSSKREYAMKALMIMPALLLQRTSVKTKNSLNKETLKRRLQLWENNNISELLQESRTLQNRLPKSQTKMTEDELTKRFTNLMLQGNVKQAVRLLEKDASNGALPLNTETLEELQTKHPEGKPKYAEMLLEGPILKVSSTIFDEITSETIMKASVKTKGSAGPSLYDADDWRNILGSNHYGTEAEDLRKSLACLAKELCISEVEDPQSLEALLACRLIPLDKNPGLRPIGIGETLRRILGKAVMSVMKLDVQVGVVNLQLTMRS